MNILQSWLIVGVPALVVIAALFTEPDAPYHRMVDVLDALRQAGAERISLQLAAAR
mgnify:CR=1 FL=1